MMKSIAIVAIMVCILSMSDDWEDIVNAVILHSIYR